MWKLSEILLWQSRCQMLSWKKRSWSAAARYPHLQIGNPFTQVLTPVCLTWGNLLCYFLPRSSSGTFYGKLHLLAGEGNGTPLHYSCLENPMDGGAWWAVLHGVARSQTWLTQLHFHFSLSCIGEGNGNPFQCSCLENPREGAAWWAAISGVTQSRSRLKQLSSSSSIYKEGISVVA